MNNGNENNKRPQNGAPRRATNPGARTRDGQGQRPAPARRPQNGSAGPRPARPKNGAPAGTQPRSQGQPRRPQNGAPKRKSRPRRHRSPLMTAAIVAAAAAICVLLTFLVLFILGFRYMSYKVIRADEEITVKYVGRVDGEGNPYDGKVIYPDKTGILAKDTSGENPNWYTISYSNGDVYRGHLKKALKHGTGVIVYSNGDRYDGNFVNDVISGESTEEYTCTYTYANGDVYTGGFMAGKKQGYGEMIFADSDDDPNNNSYYAGNFVNDLREGEGVNVYSDGSKYTGQFKGDLPHGEGTFEFANGDTYTGEFVDGVRQGEGVYVWKNGDTYTGDFANGDLNGTGTYTLDGGKRSYRGQFKNGQIVVGEGNIVG